MKNKRTTQKAKKVKVKESDSLVKAIEKGYKVDLKVRSDREFVDLLASRGVPSLRKLIKVVNQ